MEFEHVDLEPAKECWKRGLVMTSDLWDTLHMSQHQSNNFEEHEWLVLKSAFLSRFYIIILHLKYQ
jgi:hypothetical protein